MNLFVLFIFSALFLSNIEGSRNEKHTDEINLPNLTAYASDTDVIVTVPSFWNEPVWKDYKFSNLTVFYKFDINKSSECHEISGNIIKYTYKPTTSCLSSLPIAMDIDDDSIKDDDSDDIYDDINNPPEIEFGGDVFANANFVEFYYTVNVNNNSQLSNVKSNILKYDLKGDKIEKVTKSFPSKKLTTKKLTTTTPIAVMSTKTEDQTPNKSDCDCFITRESWISIEIICIICISCFAVYFLFCHIRKNSTKKVVNGKEYYINSKV